MKVKVTNEEERIWEGVDTTQCDSLSKDSGGGTEENRENLARIIGAQYKVKPANLDLPNFISFFFFFVSIFSRWQLDEVPWFCVCNIGGLQGQDWQ